VRSGGTPAVHTPTAAAGAGVHEGPADHAPAVELTGKPASLGISDADDRHGEEQPEIGDARARRALRRGEHRNCDRAGRRREPEGRRGALAGADDGDERGHGG
jgi:hypothetical protein